MPKEDKNTTAGRPAGFFREGWREIRRKFERRSLRKQLQQQDLERSQALTRLGQRAWQEKLDFASFPALSAQLTQLETRAGELGAASKALEGQGAVLEEKRRAEVARFDGERNSVEAKKRPVDESLLAARQKQSQQERAVQLLENRLAALPGELAAIEQQLTALRAGTVPDCNAKLAAAETRRQLLQAEQAQAAAELPKVREPLAGIETDVARLDNESQAYAAEINRIEGERRTSLAALDSELNRVRGQLSATARETGTLEKERGERWMQLGLALYERKERHPALADGQKEISAIDARRGSTQAALNASLAETQRLPRGTMLKFVGSFLLAPLLLLITVAGGYLGWQWWSERGQPEEARVNVNPYLTHPLENHPAYILANHLADARGDEEAASLLLEVFRTIHLGVYTPAGKKILGGAERSDNDFYLYDFQWKTLAHAFAARNSTNWENFSQLLGKNLLQLQDSTIFQTVFTEAVQARYARAGGGPRPPRGKRKIRASRAEAEDAPGSPNDPKSFLILFVDGLARRQLKPYTLSELTTRQPRDLYVDRLQSFLLMLDFFTRPPQAAAPPQARMLRFFPRLIPTVYADDPCDSVKGDEKEGEWGEGEDELGFGMDRLENAAEAAEGAGEAAGREGLRATGTAISGLMSRMSKAMDIRNAINAMMLLSAVTVTVQVAPDEMVHLPHGGQNQVNFVAQVTLDPKALPEGSIPCGSMKGHSTGSQGKKWLKGVRVEWDWDKEWEKYYQLTNETVSKMSGRYATITDEFGQTEIMWESKKTCESKGKVVGPDLVMQATAVNIIGPALDALFGGSDPVSLGLKVGPSIYQFMAPELRGYVNYALRWHEKKPKEKQY